MNWKHALHSKALAAAKNFKEAEKTLQEILRQIDQHKVYYDLGYRSLMEYAITALGLTSDVAYNHCTVAKKSQDLPEVRKAVAQGILSVAAVRHMAPVLTKENVQEMVALGSKLTQTELRREIAKRNPELTEAPEKARYVREDRLALELRVSDPLMKKLRRAQDLVSQSQRGFSSLESTLEAIVDVFLEKRDPLKKAERVQKKSIEATSETLPLVLPLTTPSRMIRKNEVKSMKSLRTKIPSSIRHSVIFRSKGQCTHTDPKGIRCNQTRWLHFHHIKPLSKGGEHHEANLTLLCSGHHRMTHRTAQAELGLQ